MADEAKTEKATEESPKVKAAKDALARAEQARKDAATKAREASRQYRVAALAVEAAEREDAARKVLRLIEGSPVVYARPEELGGYAEPNERTFLSVLVEKDGEAVRALYELLGETCPVPTAGDAPKGEGAPEEGGE